MMEARRLRALLGCTTALTALAVIQPARAQAPLTIPTGGRVVAGTAAIADSRGATTITQATSRAAINWQTFDVGSKAVVTFRQPSSQAVTLNRVVAPDPSLIAGHINANGSIVLVNPDGIVFAHGSEVNAAGLVASAPGITNRNFMAGRMIFNQPAHPNARVINQGTITIGQAGLAALVAPTVANSGVISAKLGSVVLAGARTATLDLYGDGLVSIDVAGAVKTVPVGPDGKPVKALVTNGGTIVAEGGTVLLTAKAVDGLIQNLVDAGGTVSAKGVAGRQAGTVRVAGVGGSITIPGTLIASGEGSHGTGGAIGLDATGGVTVQKTARIDASGPAGGGVVAVGTTLARAKGGPGTPDGLTAKNVGIAQGATIGANATAAGNGGRVVVLSTAHTADHGAIAAEGGPEGGNGGFVEVSGHDLALDGTINTSAPLGATGTILLDPYDLDIVAPGAADNNDIVTSNPPDPVNGVAFGAGDATGVDTVSTDVIEALNGSVTLQAVHNLEVSHSLALTKPGQSLLMEAGNNLTIDFEDSLGAGVTVSATGNVELDAASAASPTPNTGGALTIDGDVQAGGNLSLSAGTGGILLGGAFGGGGNLSANSTTGTVSLITGGDITQDDGVITAGTLTGAAPSAALQDDNVVGTLGSFSILAGEFLFFNDASGLVVGGPVDAPEGSVSVSSDGNLTVAGPVSAAGGVAEFSSGGNLAVAAPINAAGVGSRVSLVATGDVTLTGEVNATGGTVAITAGGSITEPGGAILADLFGGSSGGEALFTGVNAIGTLGFPFSEDPPAAPAFTAGGNFTFVNSGTLVLAAPVTVPTGATIALETDGLTEGSQFVYTGGAVGCEGPDTVCGALEAPGGEVSIAPLTASVPVALVGAGPQPAGTLSLDNALLAAITAGTLALTSNGAEPITISGANQLGGLTDPNTGAASGVSALLVKAGGAFTEEPLASLNVGTLAGSAASVALGGANFIPDLGPFSSSGGFEMTDTSALTVTGTVAGATGVTLDVTGGGIEIGSTAAGLISSPGTVDLVTPDAIEEFSPDGGVSYNGAIAAATLTGTAGEVFLSGSNAIGTLGSFPFNASFLNELVLNDTIGLTVAGPVTMPNASFVSLKSSGNLAVTGTIQASPDYEFPLQVTLVSGGDMVFSGQVNAAGGTVALASGGDITEPGGVILADTLGGTSGGAALLSGVNTIGTLSNVSFSSDPPPPAFSAGGDFTLVDSTPLTITAPVTVPAGHTITLVTDDLIEGSQTVFVDDVPTTIFGALEAPGGEVFIAPFTPSVPVALVGGGTGAPGTLSIDDTLLEVITAGTLALSSFEPEPITISGANQLGGLTDPHTGAASGVGVLRVNAGGAVTEEAGASLDVGGISGSAGSVALGGLNVVSTLGPFSSSGGFSLVDTVGLTVLGNVSDASGITLDVGAGNLTIGNAGTFGQLASAGTVNVQVPNGSITVPFGHVQAGTLTGTASGLANFATAHVATLGSFSVSGGSGQFALTNNAPLTITGPVSAAYLDIAAPGTLTLAGNIFTTGLSVADQSGAAPALPGSVLQVLSGGVFQQLGTSVIAPLGGGGATLRIQLPAEGGAANFANLLAGGANLVLALGPGVASGTMAAGGLLIIGTGGSANLLGSVAGIAGSAAARTARILPAVNTNYLFNGCVIQSTVCSPLSAALLRQVPQGTPNLIATGGGPSLSPAVSLPEIVLFVIPAVIGESWTDAGGFPLPNIAKLDF